MVFITGDLTNSAMNYQWTSIRKVLDKIQVPYFPLLGNHDVWSYNDTFEEPHPTGDAQFAHMFMDRFNSQGLVGATFLYNNKSCHNPEQDITSWFQNWQLDYRNIRFLALDWNSRHHAVSALGYKGAMPTAQLHDFPCGTFPWMVERISNLPSNITHVVLLQHHPFAMPLFIPEIIYSFPPSEKAKVMHELHKPGIKEKYWGVIAGHLHVWYNGLKSDAQWLTEATKDSSAFTFVRVQNGTLSTFTKFFGIDY